MVKELSGYRISDGSVLIASNAPVQVMSVLFNKHANIGYMIHKLAFYCNAFFEQCVS